MLRLARSLFLFTFAGLLCGAADLSKEPTLYVVGYAHLDTEWRWEYPQVINDYLVHTMRDNFALFEKYPHYIFNFSGANRYRLMKEYFPADFARIQQYVKSGQWFPAGSSMEEGDVNAPSAEAILRQVLYGNNWFRKELGKASAEYMIPDCFGFPISLPSILAHAGIKGFSTQKLTWGSSAPAGGGFSPERTPDGTPFNVGVWVGPDGKSVIAALNPGDYTGNITYDLSRSPGPIPPPPAGINVQQMQRYFQQMAGRVDWPRRVNRNGQISGVFTDYHYYGTGDIGGAPREESVKMLEDIVTKNDGPLHIVSATADQMFLDITPAQMVGLPHYEGEMELLNHSAGSLTSQAYLKRWIRKEELLADAAEKASVAAAWLGGRTYPLERLNDAWTLVMGGHFHDIAAGTATPKSYEFAWNDAVIAMNQFAGVLTSATQAVVAGLNTETKGTPVVVYNPLNIAREDVVEAALPAQQTVRVTGPDGKEVPAQISEGKVLFLARAPATGWAVYDVEPATAAPANSALKVTENSLENARYRVRLNQNGDVAGIFDKAASRELLAAPARLAISTDTPEQWPAWNMDWVDEQRAPRTFVGGAAKMRVVENGPVRVTVEVARDAEGSKFVQRISLSAGDAGNRVEFGNVIDWHTAAANLKASFPLAATNPMATYNWDIGTIERPTAQQNKFEVPSHQWIDLTDVTGAYGATILTDCKNGSDKPDDHTIRLTLVRTPGINPGWREYHDQSSQDWGHHEFVYGIAGHRGNWRQAQTDWQAMRLNQPLIAFETEKHAGALGKELSLLKVSNPRVRVMALKKAEQGDEVILRMVEVEGKPQQNVRVNFAGPIAAAREVNGQEQPVGPAAVTAGTLVTSFTAYQPRTFALKLGAAPAKMTKVQSQPVTLAYDLAVASNDATKSSPGFDAQGRALPAEMLPAELSFGDVRFTLGRSAVVARGQSINLPSTKFNRVYVVAASAEGDQKATFRVGSQAGEVTVEDWGGFVGQWDYRVWRSRQEGQQTDPYAEMVEIKPGFIKPADLAWYCSHRHTADGAAEAYSYSYLFVYGIDAPGGAHTLTLPNNERIRVMAVAVADEPAGVHPVQALYDTLGGK